MTVAVSIPSPLRGCCAGAAELAFAAGSLRAVLEELEQHHPELHRSICDETGAVRRHINLFVNTEHIRERDGLLADHRGRNVNMTARGREQVTNAFERTGPS